MSQLETHPLVLQLRFTLSEFIRGIKNVGTPARTRRSASGSAIASCRSSSAMSTTRPVQSER